LVYKQGSPDPKSSEVVFFLGAGASVAAGVPDTGSFVKEFRKSIQDTAKKATIDKIITTLEKTEKDNIDVELLLEVLTKLNEKDREPLLQFYTDCKFILEEYSEKQPLINDLKNFLKKRTIVSEEKIYYLKPLLDLIEQYSTLDIISLNYDTCIEQFCHVYNLLYQDGFDSHWNPEVFDRENTVIRLYKAHGSVMWYKSEKGDYRKSDVFTENIEIQLMAGEKAENLILYPYAKMDYAGPLLELLVYIKHILESDTCKFLIVVGYSFRDPHIQRILWEAAKKNTQFHLILIDPNAYEIYNKRLKYYNTESSNRSPLFERVVCLPYFFEKILPEIKDYIENLRLGLEHEFSQHQEEIKGKPASWISSVKHYVDAEYIEKAESLLQKTVSEPDRDLKLGFEIPLKMAMNLIAGKQEEKASKFYKEFNSHLTKVAVEGINANIVYGQSRSDRLPGTPQDYQIEFKFNYRSTSNDVRTPFKETIESLSVFCETRTELSKSGNLQKISEKLKKVKYYLEPFKDGKIGFEEYIKLRESEIRDIKIFRNECKKLPEAGSLSKQQLSEQQRRLEANIVEVERSILKGIIEEE